MDIKYVGNVGDYVHGRKKRQNVTRWMYVPKPKYKPAWGEILCAVVCIITIVFTIAFAIFAMRSM